MRKLLSLLVLALGAGVVQADDGTFYLGAGISRNQLSGISNAGIDYSDISRTSWKAFVGFRPISVVAGELDYLDLGSQTSTFVTGTTSSDAKAFAGFAVGFLPIPLPYLDIYGKAGLARWQLNGSSQNLFSFSSNGTAFAWGAGTQVHFGNFGARLEYENFNITNTSGAGIVSLSLMLNFM
jgi:opacity protein-like surface antigen